MTLNASKAEQDFSAGKFHFYCKGKACAGNLPFIQYLRDQYGIIFCLLADSTPAYDKYTTRMFGLLRGKFGKDVFYEAQENAGIKPGCYPRWPEALVHTEIRMFADHGACLWDRNGCSTWLEYITGKTEELDDRLEAWADRYSTVADIDDHGKWFVPCSPEELNRYNEEGLMLAKEVRRLLPNTTILTYARVMENAFWGDSIQIDPENPDSSGHTRR
ncbi:MAG: hypothetical protein WC701_09735 [Kiritimatiellales bacterium]|jgi:hypothetical protein